MHRWRWRPSALGASLTGSEELGRLIQIQGSVKIRHLADCVRRGGIRAFGQLVLRRAVVGGGVEVCLHVRNGHDGVGGRGPGCPAVVAVAPVVEVDAARVRGETGCQVADVLAIGVIGDFFGGPVETIFVVSVIGVEGDLWLLRGRWRGGVDDEPYRVGVPGRSTGGEELNVDFVGVVIVLGLCD